MMLSCRIVLTLLGAAVAGSATENPISRHPGSQVYDYVSANLPSYTG